MALAELLQHPHFVPFLEVFKDGKLIDSLQLQGHENFMLGRHEHCDHLLAHPSISRHHLEIRVLHATREILLTDLGSVHGTWINGKQLSPLKPITVKEGEAIRLGVSSRIFKLQWKLPEEQRSENSSEKANETIVPVDTLQWSHSHSSFENLSISTESDGSQISDNGTEDILSYSSNNQEDDEEEEPSALVLTQAMEALSLKTEAATVIEKSSEECLDSAYEEHVNTDTFITQETSLHNRKPYLHHQNRDTQRVLPPLPPLRRMPFVPLQSNVSEKTMGSMVKNVQGSFQQQRGMADDVKPASDSNLLIRRCNSAPSPLHCSTQSGLTERRNNRASDMDFSKRSVLTERRNDETSDMAFTKQSAGNSSDKRVVYCEKENIAIKTTAKSGIKANTLTGMKDNEMENITIKANTENAMRAQIIQGKKNTACKPNKETVLRAKIILGKKDRKMEKTAINSIAEALSEPRIIHGEKDDEKEDIGTTANTENTPEAQIISVQENIAIRGSNADAAIKLPIMLGERYKLTQLCPTSSLDEPVLEHDEDELYPSDKENQDPILLKDEREEPLGVVLRRSSSQGCKRIPFQPLGLVSTDVYRSFSSSSSYTSSDDESTKPKEHHRRPSTVVQNLDNMLQELKGLARSESQHEWHIVVDSTSLLDPASFKCLKLLEGIKEVRLIIPQIVIRELEVCKRKDRASMSPDVVLKWIESCMIKFPTWVHVQNSAENPQFGVATPPVSPRHVHLALSSYGSGFNDLMSCPTNGDHVLNCALLFSKNVIDGQVVLLTNDTALRIKAMAEGLMCESATQFCESLWSPYSERFLWSRSVAHHSHRLPRAMSCSNARASKESGILISNARGLSSRKHQFVEGLKKHCWQARGLKALLN